jgi:hypothetical protein
MVTASIELNKEDAVFLHLRGPGAFTGAVKVVFKAIILPAEADPRRVKRGHMLRAGESR